MFYEIFHTEQFWVLVAFIIFVGVIYNPVRKILTTNLDNKIQEIKNNINEAEKLKNEAQLTLSEIKKRQNEVKKEIELINEEVQGKISTIENDAESKLKEQMDKRKNLTLMKIEQMTREANNDIQKHILTTSLAAVLNILEKKLNDKEKQNLIDQSINELESVLKN